MRSDDLHTEVEETRATMAWVVDQAVTLLHPVMPFVTEDIWALTGTRDRMLVHGDWPEYGAELIDADADRQMNWVIGLIEGIRSARAQMGVPAGAKLDLIVTEAIGGGMSWGSVVLRW